MAAKYNSGCFAVPFFGKLWVFCCLSLLLGYFLFGFCVNYEEYHGNDAVIVVLLAFLFGLAVMTVLCVAFLLVKRRFFPYKTSEKDTLESDSNCSSLNNSSSSNV
jgi:MFS family permease